MPSVTATFTGQILCALTALIWERAENIFKEIEKQTSWRNSVEQRGESSRSRPASVPSPRNESQVPGPGSSKSNPRLQPCSRDEVVLPPPSKWTTTREQTPIISSGSSDAQAEKSPQSTEGSPEPRSGAPNDDGLVQPPDEESDDDDDDESDDDDDSEESDNDEDEEENQSDEVADALRGSTRVETADLRREGGASLIQKLIAKVIPPIEGEKVLPRNVREWTFRDIASLPT
ncbi:hypothetical protein BD309DRAFT_1057192, partial [Dichomitus squalens]